MKQENTLPDCEKLPDLQFLAKFIPSQELDVLKDNLKGDERAFFIEMLNELEDRIRKMPSDRSDLTMESPVLLHYFCCRLRLVAGGARSGRNDRIWLRAVGQRLGKRRVGRVWLPEIFDLHVGSFRPELDLYWDTEKTLNDIKERIERNIRERRGNKWEITRESRLKIRNCCISRPMPISSMSG